MTYYVGGTQQFAHSETDTNGNPISQQLGRWTVANPAIASITQSGLATWLAPGQTVVLFTIPSYHRSGGIPVVVHAPVPVSLSAVPASVTMLVGDVAKVVLSGLDADSNPITSLEIDSAGSSDDTIAELVTLDGFEFLVLGKGAGSATLTIRAGSATATIAVTVAVNDTTGISQSDADARYVNVAGDTMTGDLVLTAADVHARALYGDASHLTGLPSPTPDWSAIANKPTTIAGYGITDFNSLGDARWAALAHTHAFASLTGKPTTISGYGITDFNALGDARWAALVHAHAAADITSGTLATARLGSGAASSGTYLRGDQTWAAPPGAPVSSVFGRTGDVASAANDYTFAQLASKPTTIAGYGITDLNALGDARWAALATTLAGYGITDAYTKTASDARFAPIAVPWASVTATPTTIAGYGITDFNSLGDARWDTLGAAAAEAVARAAADAAAVVTGDTRWLLYNNTAQNATASAASGAPKAVNLGYAWTPSGTADTSSTGASLSATIDGAADASGSNAILSGFWGTAATLSTRSGATNIVAAMRALAAKQNTTGDVNYLMGLYGQVDHHAGHVGDAEGIYIFQHHYNTSSADRLIGIHVDGAQIDAGATVTSRYGLLIEGTQVGSGVTTNEWGVYVGGSVKSHFGGAVDAASFAGDGSLLTHLGFAHIDGLPTTIAGYGITDFNSLGDARWAALVHTHAAADITSGTIATARLGSGAASSSTYLRGDQTWAALPSAPVTSVFGRTGVVAAAANDYTFAQLASIPTTVAGYGITDFNSLGDARWSLLGHTHTFASLTSKPTTISGFGITDFNSLGDARWAAIATTLAGYGITDAYTKTASDARYAAIATTLAGYGITDAYTKTASDARYAAIATTLAGYGITDAYTKTAADARYAPIAVPWSTLTGTPTTVSGYGITDFNSLGDARWAALAHTHTFASLTSKPTTVAGYGITDAAPLNSPALTGTPTAPTPAYGDSSTQIATTAFVGDNDRAMMERYDCTSGGLASTYPRGIGLGTANLSALSTGVLNMTRIFLPKGMSINAIRYWSGTTALASGTHQWFALFDSARNKLCVTADDTSTAWGASTMKSLAVTGAPFVTTYSGFYYLGILVTATTTPTLLGVSNGLAAIEGAAPVLGGTADGSLTTPGTCPSTTIAITFSTRRHYAEVA